MAQNENGTRGDSNDLLERIVKVEARIEAGEKQHEKLEQNQERLEERQEKATAKVVSCFRQLSRRMDDATGLKSTLTYIAYAAGGGACGSFINFIRHLFGL